MGAGNLKESINLMPKKFEEQKSCMKEVLRILKENHELREKVEKIESNFYLKNQLERENNIVVPDSNTRTKNYT